MKILFASFLVNRYLTYFESAYGASAMKSPIETNEDRRDFLKKCGTFAAVTPPAVTFLLSTSMSSKAIAKSGGGGGHGPKGNNGVGNGLDGQPPGNPPVNDGPGSGPGHPGHGH
jgi:hypothetical protein